MKTTTIREVAQRAPRLPTYIPTKPARPAQTEVWPGLTRAQLRDIVIEQIG